LAINKTQYFEGIPEEVYNFHIGGYQVCQKWLKDRKGRQLTEEDVEHYQKIVVALNGTIRIMNEIDAVIEERGVDAYIPDSKQAQEIENVRIEHNLVCTAHNLKVMWGKVGSSVAALCNIKGLVANFAFSLFSI
jgi:hypothetical protein